jgi:hypothetical protein
MLEPVTHETESLPETANHVAKLVIADQYRLMSDNQRTLNTTTKADRVNRDYGNRVREALARKQFGSDWPEAAKPETDEEMNIYIDSPITITQPSSNGQVPSSTQPQLQSTPPVTEQPTGAALATAENPSSWAKTIAPWVAAAALGPGGYLAAKWVNPPVPPTVTSPDSEYRPSIGYCRFQNQKLREMLMPRRSPGGPAADNAGRGRRRA